MMTKLHTGVGEMVYRSPLWRSRFIGYNQPAPRLVDMGVPGREGGGI